MLGRRKLEATKFLPLMTLIRLIDGDRDWLMQKSGHASCHA